MYFPIFVDLTGKKLLVVGGGTIAARRVRVLADFADEITVVAPQMSEGILDLVSVGEDIRSELQVPEHQGTGQFMEPDLQMPGHQGTGQFMKSDLQMPEHQGMGQFMKPDLQMSASRQTKQYFESALQESVHYAAVPENTAALTCDIRLCRHPFLESDLDGHDLVFAATDDSILNQEICRLCRGRGIPVNVCSDQSLCDFQFPSVVQDGDVVVGINASGRNHALVKKTRRQIEAALYVGTERSKYDKESL